jgi:hypothetical protein
MSPVRSLINFFLTSYSRIIGTPYSVTVAETVLQRIFNDGGYLARIQAGEFSANFMHDRHPCPDAANQPFCTRSQLIQYLALGGSGLPDPKRLLHDGVLYMQAPKRVSNPMSGPLPAHRKAWLHIRRKADHEWRRFLWKLRGRPRKDHN